MKPTILITASRANTEDKFKARHQIASVYAQSIRNAGGIPVLACGGDPSDYASVCDAVLFTGGDDVHPSLFGETLCNESVITEPIRDDEELNIFDAFFRENKPIFGICRGIQLINVALGGSLWQDIPAQLTDTLIHSGNATHSVSFTDNSILARLFPHKIRVNSYHHQSVKQLGDGLTATAHSDDGIIEAIESTERNIIAVQWHPERIANSNDCGDRENMSPFFEKLVELAKGNGYDKYSKS